MDEDSDDVRIGGIPLGIALVCCYLFVICAACLVGIAMTLFLLPIK